MNDPIFKPTNDVFFLPPPEALDKILEGAGNRDPLSWYEDLQKIIWVGQHFIIGNLDIREYTLDCHDLTNDVRAMSVVTLITDVLDFHGDTGAPTEFAFVNPLFAISGEARRTEHDGDIPTTWLVRMKQPPADMGILVVEDAARLLREYEYCRELAGERDKGPLPPTDLPDPLGVGLAAVACALQVAQVLLPLELELIKRYGLDEYQAAKCIAFGEEEG